jgi:hypothetical protein
MKCEILISGQPSGNNILRKHFYGSDYELKKTHFNSYLLIFKTKKEAYEALSKCYKALLDNDYGIEELSFRKKESLYYDASSAKIQ